MASTNDSAGPSNTRQSHFVSRASIRFPELQSALAKRPANGNAAWDHNAPRSASATSSRDSSADRSHGGRRYRGNSPASEDEGLSPYPSSPTSSSEPEGWTAPLQHGGGGGPKRRKRALHTGGAGSERKPPLRALTALRADLEAGGRRSAAGLGLPNGGTALQKAKGRRRKLGTFDGVYVPTCLNITGIILFLRFSFILGQVGLLGALGLLAAAYLIDVLTTFSLGAVATNGQVRGGGAYYLISRSLGPEFGGSIGIVFITSQALNASMNLIGFVETLTTAFGITETNPGGFLPVSYWMSFLYASCVLLLCTLVCLVGSPAFSRMTTVIGILVGASLVSIIVSFVSTPPFSNPSRHIAYTGLSLKTLRSNLLPEFTSNAAGSAMPHGVKDSYQSVFGVLFPAVNGILAGASLSGQLRKPSKSIPKGTIWALESIFVLYVLCLLGMAASISRPTFLHDLAVLRDVSVFPPLITCGILASTFFSALMGITACGKILQAIARDNLIPMLKPFSMGTERGDDPAYAILAAYVVCQVTLLSDSVNTIASLVTMSTLMVFTAINLACFTLRIAGSPNFRPSFRLFSEWTALAGVVLAFSAMYLVGPVAASSALIGMISLFSVIHYSSPPKQWGEVTQSLIYHQVRKYLLRLDERKHNVKYWRPQILLFTNNPRHDWNSILFCNSLKKGGLYVLGHVLKGEFSAAIQELKLQQHAWLRLVDVSGIKAFVDITAAADERIGARHLLLTSGLGGMRPNICILGFPSDSQWKRRGKQRQRSRSGGGGSDTESDVTVRARFEEDVQIENLGELPTDQQRPETPITPSAFVGIVEDAIVLNKAVGIAYGFRSLGVPPSSRSKKASGRADQRKKWIDLWPILQEGDSAWETYTMVLQLGTILSYVPSWRRDHRLRVTVFCENADEIAEERRRTQQLLDNLRMKATLRVCMLSTGSVASYECLVNGAGGVGQERVEEALGGDPWWEALKFMRSTQPLPSPSPSLPEGAEGEGTLGYRTSELDFGSRDTFGSLAQRARSNNLRIQRVHPHSYDSESDSEAGRDEEDEDEDDDDDVAARAAYRRARVPSLTELPDKPSYRPLLSSTQRHYGSRQRATPVACMTPIHAAAPTARLTPPTLLSISPDRVARESPATVAQAPVVVPHPGLPPPRPHRSDPQQQHQQHSRDRNRDRRAPPPPARSASGLPQLDFNSLPMRAQFVCLNDLIRINSDDDTAIIFTSLPPPDPGTADTYEKSIRYLEHIDIFLRDLRPALAIHAKQMAVTTTL